MDRLGHLAGDRQRFGKRQWAARQALGEVVALDQLHHDGARGSGVLDAVNVCDVRMIQRRERAGFPFKAGEPLGIGRKSGRQNLDSPRRDRASCRERDRPRPFRLRRPSRESHSARFGCQSPRVLDHSADCSGFAASAFVFRRRDARRTRGTTRDNVSAECARDSHL